MRSALWIALCVAVCPFAASGDPVPAATHSITLGNSAPITVPGSYSQGNDLGEILVEPAPRIRAHVGGSGLSRIEVQYWFRVDGPQDGLEVPIDVAGAVHINAGGAVFQKDMIWGVTASLIAQAFDGPLGGEVNEIDTELGDVGCNPLSVGTVPVPPPIPSCAATVQDEDLVLELTTLTGADNRISMLAAANNQESFVADFDAVVDPVISFAPGFDATGYTITVSDGIGNSAPEPGSALLASTAIGLLVHLRRRK